MLLHKGLCKHYQEGGGGSLNELHQGHIREGGGGAGGGGGGGGVLK